MELYTCVFEGAILTPPQLSSESRSASGVHSVELSFAPTPPAQTLCECEPT